MSHVYDIHPEVREALRAKRPIVALESTIISHGMPYPQNLDTALAVERIVREEGCVPATVAVLDGRIKVGLSRDDLEKLARTGLKARKTSRRDLALVVSQTTIERPIKGVVGATTVSGTMLIANQAGIKVFVTGGIGGVHRGGEDSMDVSADLTELGRTPVAVICAGAKSILDIERTLEFLETQGVTVVSYGDSDDFPAFYTPKSGYRSIAHLKTPDACASLIKANNDLQLQSGMVIAVPIPIEDAPKDAWKIEKAVLDAIDEANTKGVRGKDITPFLLDRVKQITQGESLKSNIALVKNNARIGSRIAASFAAQCNRATINSSASPATASRPVIIGGTVLDVSTRFEDGNECNGMPSLGTSHPGTCKQSMGGVGRNMAEACSRTGGNPLFVSAVGDDVAGDGLIQEMAGVGMAHAQDVSGIKRIVGHQTATYNAFLKSNGDMLVAVADMRMHAEIDGEEVSTIIKRNLPPFVSIDGNLGSRCTQRILETCAENNIPVLFEPTSEIKAFRLFNLDHNLLKASIKYATPNEGELSAMAWGYQSAKDQCNGLPKQEDDAARLHRGRGLMLGQDNLQSNITVVGKVIPTIIVKRGREGVLIARDGSISVTLGPTQIYNDCISVTGAGDSMVGTLVTGLSRYYSLKSGEPTVEDLRRFAIAGMRAAEMSLMTDRAVAKDLGEWVFKL
ncbi:pseudouridylate synthase [Spizellomyces sp. 'palustris']|nr:pseudouridylate synthase [Spizellomyces sp. 'palustris']